MGREVKVILLLPSRATTSRNQHNEDASIEYKKVFLFKSAEAGEADEIYMFYIDRAGYITSIIIHTFYISSPKLEYVVLVLCRRLLILCH